MFKVIKLENDMVYVGKAGGSYTAIPKDQFGFEPQVGDHIEFYQNGDEYIVSKIDSMNHFIGSHRGHGTSSKSKLTAGLLALFLSPFYYFYIGRTGMGIFRMFFVLTIALPFIGQVLFLPINLIWSLIVAVLVFTSKAGSKWHQDVNGLELMD